MTEEEMDRKIVQTNPAPITKRPEIKKRTKTAVLKIRIGYRSCSDIMADIYECPNCGENVHYIYGELDYPEYCSQCGIKIKWENTGRGYRND